MCFALAKVVAARHNFVMSNEIYDVVIAGGAVMGSSTAAHLAEMIGGERILVVEKDPSYTRCASALSASSIRQQFSQAANIAISLYGIAFMRDIGEKLGTPRDPVSIGLHEGGYLYLAGEAGAIVLAENQTLQRSMGADILLLDPPGIAERFPYMAGDGLAAAAYGASGEGWFDGYGLMQAFRAKARRLGVTYRTGEVVGIEREGDQVTAVTLKDGGRIGCGAFVNTAGASGARKIAALAGIAIPVYGKKRCVFQFTAEDRLANFPLLIDTSGVWCRPEGEGYIAGFSPDDLDQQDASDDFEVDWPLFDEVIWPALAARVPAFERIKPGRAWAGHYDMCLLDHNAIIGRLGNLQNMYIAAGFSGHGIQQSPAIGRGLAELITTGGFRTLDLSDFSYDRIAAGRPLLERNII